MVEHFLSHQQAVGFCPLKQCPGCRCLPDCVGTGISHKESFVPTGCTLCVVLSPLNLTDPVRKSIEAATFVAFQENRSFIFSLYKEALQDASGSRMSFFTLKGNYGNLLRRCVHLGLLRTDKKGKLRRLASSDIVSDSGELKFILSAAEEAEALKGEACDVFFGKDAPYVSVVGLRVLEVAIALGVVTEVLPIFSSESENSARKALSLFNIFRPFSLIRSPEYQQPSPASAKDTASPKWRNELFPSLNLNPVINFFGHPAAAYIGLRLFLAISLLIPAATGIVAFATAFCNMKDRVVISDPSISILSLTLFLHSAICVAWAILVLPIWNYIWCVKGRLGTWSVSEYTSTPNTEKSSAAFFKDRAFSNAQRSTFSLDEERVRARLLPQIKQNSKNSEVLAFTAHETLRAAFYSDGCAVDALRPHPYHKAIGWLVLMLLVCLSLGYACIAPPKKLPSVDLRTLVAPLPWFLRKRLSAVVDLVETFLSQPNCLTPYTRAGVFICTPLIAVAQHWTMLRLRPYFVSTHLSTRRLGAAAELIVQAAPWICFWPLLLWQSFHNCRPSTPTSPLFNANINDIVAATFHFQIELALFAIKKWAIFPHVSAWINRLTRDHRQPPQNTGKQMEDEEKLLRARVSESLGRPEFCAASQYGSLFAELSALAILGPVCPLLPAVVLIANLVGAKSALHELVNGSRKCFGGTLSIMCTDASVGVGGYSSSPIMHTVPLLPLVSIIMSTKTVITTLIAGFSIRIGFPIAVVVAYVLLLFRTFVGFIYPASTDFVTSYALCGESGMDLDSTEEKEFTDGNRTVTKVDEANAIASIDETRLMETVANFLGIPHMPTQATAEVVDETTNGAADALPDITFINRFLGDWIVDLSRSDRLEPISKIMGLPYVARRAIDSFTPTSTYSLSEPDVLRITTNLPMRLTKHLYVYLTPGVRDQDDCHVGRWKSETQLDKPILRTKQTRESDGLSMDESRQVLCAWNTDGTPDFAKDVLWYRVVLNPPNGQPTTVNRYLLRVNNPPDDVAMLPRETSDCADSPVTTMTSSSRFGDENKSNEFSSSPLSLSSEDSASTPLSFVEDLKVCVSHACARIAELASESVDQHNWACTHSGRSSKIYQKTPNGQESIGRIDISFPHRGELEDVVHYLWNHPQAPREIDKNMKHCNIWKSFDSIDARVTYQAFSGRFGFAGRAFLMGARKMNLPDQNMVVLGAASLPETCGHPRDLSESITLPCWADPDSILPRESFATGRVLAAGYTLKRSSDGIVHLVYINQVDLNSTGVPAWIVNRVKADNLKAIENVIPNFERFISKKL